MTEEQNKQALMSIDEELSKEVATLKDNLKVTGNAVTLKKTGQFSFPGGDMRSEFEAVVVGFRYRNQYFPKTYVAGQFSEAVCFAIAENEETLVPAVSKCTQPQSVSCAACPQNQFGSHPSGRGGKACQNQFLMAVQMPDLGQDDSLYILKASATAVSAASATLLKAADMFGHYIKAVIKFSAEDVKGEYVRMKMEIISMNDDYVKHAGNRDTARMALEHLPDNKAKERAEAEAHAAAGGAVYNNGGGARADGGPVDLVEPEAAVPKHTVDKSSARGAGRSRAS